MIALPLRRVRISKELLARILAPQVLRPEERVTSNLPSDIEVVHVYEHPDDIERGGNCFTVILSSRQWTEVPVDERIPELQATFTRAEAR